jgi:alkylation response protein AidB-like acyl-CoA dehydrogenase
MYPLARDLEDHRFVLFDQLAIDRVLEADRDTLDAVLAEAARLTEEVIAPINRPADREGVAFSPETGVSTPAGLKAAWQAIADGGWIGLTIREERGGMGLPFALNAAVQELFFSGSAAFMMYPGLTATVANLLADEGPEAIGALAVDRLLRGVWAGTMCLTEADAGSDVGANRTLATPTETEGVYNLVGEKIFISGGDHDLTENIVHVLLARTPNAPPGTRGLSLFLAPKYLFDEGGNPSSRNGAFVTNVEHKMGIHASATCTLRFGDGQPCTAWRIGAEGEGMALMFRMMNEARLGTALQGVALGAAAFRAALGYAQERRQGSSWDKLRDAEAPRVPIIAHPDVRRMLLDQQCKIAALRSLCLRLGLWADQAHRGDERARADLDLLTPIAKAWGTDVGFAVACDALQVHGGYGYLVDYPVEQYVRDAKIASIYEGTNGIQAMDLIGRKLRMEGGAVFLRWLETGKQACDLAEGAGFSLPAAAIRQALDAVGAAAMSLAERGMTGGTAIALAHAVPFLRAMAIVVLALESLDQAVAASRLEAAGSQARACTDKPLNLRHYVSHVLPEAIALSRVVRAGDDAALDSRLFA